MNEDLWTLAATRLRDKDKACAVLNHSVNISDILQSVAERKKECIEKQWTIPRGGNKNAVVLRDVFTKIAVWINKFVVAGDMVVQYDPSHAALPWALIRFLLNVSVENVQQYSVIAEGVEQITLALAHHKVVERLYLKRSNESTTHLKNGLTGLYTLILQFLMKAQRFYTKSTAHKAFTSVMNLSSKFSRCLDDINRQEGTVKKYIDLVEAEYRGDVERALDDLSIEEGENFNNLKGILQDLQRPINRMERDLKTLHDGSTTSERGNILQWISPIPYLQHHNQAKRDVLAGTGVWFLNDEKVLRWLSSSSSSIMWLHGIAGSGKTKLINPAEPERATPDAILRSLVRQLACSTSDETIVEPVKKLYSSRGQNGFAAGPLSLEESTALIIELSQNRPLTTIIIDALDECDLSSRGHLLDALSRILQDSCSLVKILVSSRADADIVCHFSDCPNLQIEASQNQKDIEHYVNIEVESLINRKKLLYGKIPKELKQTIKRVLREQAQGMFRWVSLQLQSLLLFKSEDTIRKRLGKLPATLRDLYNETYVERLEQHDVVERLIAKAAFRLLMCQQEPLDTGTFLLALPFCVEERRTISSEALLDLCANFLILDTDLNVFRFAHLSVREFLEQKEGFDPASNHAIAAQCCLQYLLDVKPCYKVKTENGWYTETEEDPSSQHHAAFRNLCHEYICLYWPFHFNESSSHRHEPPLKDLFWKFMLHDQTFARRQFVYWVRLMNRSDIGPRLKGWRYGLNRLNYGVGKGADCMFVAIAWNFCDVLQYHINTDSHFVHLNSFCWQATPLHLACRYGNTDGAKLLIDNGANLEIKDNNNHTPMMEAIVNAHTTIVRLLLQRGASPDSEPIPVFGNYLFCAASRRCIDIVKTLLDAGANLDLGDEHGETALNIAFQQKNLAMVETILASSGEANEITKIAWIKGEQLIRAVVDGEKAGVSGILREWPSTKMSSRHLNNALREAAERNQKDSIRLLVAKGADMDASFGYEPVLSQVAYLAGWSLLSDRKLLLGIQYLRNSEDPNVMYHGQTLLRLAICYRIRILAIILLKNGADINQGGMVCPPLVLAANRGYLEEARFLLHQGADIERTGRMTLDDRDNVPRSALYWARKKEHGDMVQLLLQHGAQDGPGSCPYQHEPGSCPYGHGPGVCPHELGRVEDTTDGPEPFESDRTPSDEALAIESEVS